MAISLLHSLKRRILCVTLSYMPTTKLTLSLASLVGLESESVYLYKILSRSNKPVVQVGANDGVMCDPLSRFITLKPKQKFFRIEPHPYYYSRLVSNHSTDANVTCLNCAITDDESCFSRELFYIPIEIADKMNGDKIHPQNNWAHGQGSFFKDVVVQNILTNSFRGSQYTASIPIYISSISSVFVPTYTLRKLANLIGLLHIYLLLIDVQGAELSILKSLGEIRPEFIVYEHDLEREDSCAPLLHSLGYKPLLESGINKIYKHYI
jgi:FkbM family methyltransferase